MFYFIILVIMTLVFIYNIFLYILDDKSTQREIPNNVKDIYDETTYKKWLSYHQEKNYLHLYSLITKYLVMMILMIFKVFSKFAGIFPDSLIMQTLATILLYELCTVILSNIFQYIDTMKVEEKYGFNKTTHKTFFIDLIKNLLIEFVIVFGLVYLFGILHVNLGNWLIIIFSIIVFIFLFVIFAFNSFFIRIFNKYVPLEAGSLREKLENLLTSNGYKVREIGVIDGSKRSTKSNAFFTGIGKFKTIVLYDTLINTMTEEEIVAVFAHELGHGKHHDTVKGYIESMIVILLYVVLAWLLVSCQTLFIDFGFANINYGFAMIILTEVILDLFNPLIGIIQNKISRRHEYEADHFACEKGYAKILISALKKLAKNNLVNLNPHPFIVKLNYSHPPLSLRIAAIETYIKENE